MQASPDTTVMLFIYDPLTRAITQLYRACVMEDYGHRTS